eukprot:CAMPEP_0172535940 /NCGR_PEP_ID=MMETSP1067-20121228/7767_1 /TAXON_ID=265564 ORGANISM="Thalassiosira punctigera, Strain Tpunct2005C2" /NCGR_SAMPLE_ID=MMETSP1067 /ASSEMBLY_ACC=CAM_ASM_000444 /LENGTH=164 /DNA_ID=CAMNT_0013320911 /DNA_START=34 /DNA_END=528 /DNA_ORIENTATION=-
MVYPKHQALPSSPHKKAKTSTVTNDAETPIAPTTDAASDSSDPRSDQANAFDVICEMLGNYNAMMSAIAASVKRLEEESAKNAALLNEKFDELLHRVERLEQRVGDIEDRTEANAESGAEMSRAVDALAGTAGILESRLGSMERRVFRLVVRSSKRKRKDAGGK